MYIKQTKMITVYLDVCKHIINNVTNNITNNNNTCIKLCSIQQERVKGGSF